MLYFDLDGLACFEGCRDIANDVHACCLGHGQSLLFIVDVGDFDCPLNDFADLIGLVAVVALRYDQFVRNIFLIRIRSVGDSQCTFHFADLVVLCIGSFLQCVCEGVCAGSNQCLGSGHVISCAIGSDKSFCRHVAVCQCGAVVNLTVCCGSQGDCLRTNG